MPTFDDKLGAQKRFSFTSRAVPPGTFAVVDLKGTAAISRPYEFELTLISENAQIPLDSLIDKPATLMVHPRSPDEPSAPYHGLIKEFDQSSQIGSYTLYRALLTPRVWDLTLDKISEVYLEQTIPQVIEKELRDGGLGPSDYALRLGGTYKPWPYLCQFQETDLGFITRLMEREGMYYYFEQGEEQEKLIVTDAKNFHPASVQKVSYHPAAQLETGLKEDAMRTWLGKQRPLPRKVVLQDYNAETAALSLMAEAEVSQSGKGEVRIYGENFRVPEEGRRLAKIRSEELLCRQLVFHGEGNVIGLRAGFFIELQGHYRADFNGRYFVTDVRHEGAQGGMLLAGLTAGEGATATPREDFYRSECTAIPADVQFRPERLTPKARIYGNMTAFIDSEGSGQYAELDKQGRYKVQLPFDKTDKGPDKASAWIRMATPYTGKDHGMHFPLHKGAEVLLSFVDGDPNQPVIIGSVPNSENPNLVTQSNQTQSVIHTAGGNHMVLEDQDGSQRIGLSTPTSNTYFRMGAPAPPSTVGAAWGGSAETEGFATGTDGDWSGNFKGNYSIDVGGVSVSVIAGGATYTCLGFENYSVLGIRTDIMIGPLDISIGWNKSVEISNDKFSLTTFEVNATDKQLEAIETKIHAVETSVHTAQNDIQAVDSRVDTTNSRITNVVTNIQDVESDLEAVTSRVSVTESTIENHSDRITNVATNIQDVETDLNTVATRVDTAETQIRTIETAVDAVEMDVRNSGMAMTNTDLFIIS